METILFYRMYEKNSTDLIDVEFEDWIGAFCFFMHKYS